MSLYANSDGYLCMPMHNWTKSKSGKYPSVFGTATKREMKNGILKWQKTWQIFKGKKSFLDSKIARVSKYRYLSSTFPSLANLFVKFV